MAKLEKIVNGNFDEVLKKIENGILKGSISASLEDSSDFKIDNCRCSVRVFERYSLTGDNRVSLNVTMFQVSNSKIYVSAISSGGSTGAFLKLNTFGESSFLNTLNKIL